MAAVLVLAAVASWAIPRWLRATHAHRNQTNFGRPAVTTRRHNP